MGEPRIERCTGCFRPPSLCYCNSVPTIDNQTEVVLIQHVRERDHAFNTARMVHRALKKSQLVWGTKKTLASKQLDIQPNAGLLFPTTDSVDLAEIALEDRPQQLVIIDGTWSQAKAIVNSLPQLRDLQRFHLSPTTPGQYRIRLEPTDTSLSTVEATVSALKSLEADTANLDQLITAFDTMVQKQLDHPAVQTEHYEGGPISGTTFNIPKMLAIDPNKIVVAYGEAAYRAPNQPKHQPVYWCAENLGTGEFFSQAIQAENPVTETFLQHLDLPAQVFKEAIGSAEFFARWNEFCTGAKLLVAYNHGTIRLLRDNPASSVSNITLKAIHYPDEIGVGLSLPELVEALGVNKPKTPPIQGRSHRRLASTISLLHYLRSEL